MTIWRVDKEADYDRCETCKHFTQHYVFAPDGSGYMRTFAGHCYYPRTVKDKLNDDKCCKYYEKNELWKLRGIL